MKELALSLLRFLAIFQLLGTSGAAITMPLMPSIKRKRAATMVVSANETGESSVLDLPELTINIKCILTRLASDEPQNMAGVCPSKRERCRDDDLSEGPELRGALGELNAISP